MAVYAVEFDFNLEEMAGLPASGWANIFSYAIAELGWEKTADTRILRLELSHWLYYWVWNPVGGSPIIYQSSGSSLSIDRGLGLGAEALYAGALTFGEWAIAASFDDDTNTYAVTLQDPNGDEHSYSGAISPPLSPPIALDYRRFGSGVRNYGSVGAEYLAGWIIGSAKHSIDAVSFAVDGTPDTEEDFEDEAFDPPWEWEWAHVLPGEGANSWSCVDSKLTFDFSGPTPPLEESPQTDYLTLTSIEPTRTSPRSLSLCRLSPSAVVAVLAPESESALAQGGIRTELDGAWEKATVIHCSPHPTPTAWKSPSCCPRQGRLWVAGVIPSRNAASLGALDSSTWETEADLAALADSAWSWCSASLRPLSGGIDVLALDAPDGGPYTWYQAVALWNHEGDELTFSEAVDTGIGGSADAAGSLRRWVGGGLLFAAIDDADDAHLWHCPCLSPEAAGEWEDLGTIGSGYAAVEIEALRPLGPVLAMLLDTSGEAPVWYQSYGLPEVDGSAVTFCEPVLSDGLPNSAEVRGGLLQIHDGSLLFAMVDDADDTRFFTCPAIAPDGTGSWTEVAT